MPNSEAKRVQRAPSSEGPNQPRLLIATLLSGVAISAAILTTAIGPPWRERLVLVAILAGIVMTIWLASLVTVLLGRACRTLRYQLAAAVVARQERGIKTFPFRGRVEGGPDDGEPAVIICLRLPMGASELVGVKCQAQAGRSALPCRALLRIPDGLVAYFPQSFGLSQPSRRWYRFDWSINDEVIATTRLWFGDDLSYRETTIARLSSWAIEWAYENADRVELGVPK